MVVPCLEFVAKLRDTLEEEHMSSSRLDFFLVDCCRKQHALSSCFYHVLVSDFVFSINFVLQQIIGEITKVPTLLVGSPKSGSLDVILPPLIILTFPIKK